jgi:hypothetical protein
VTFRVGDTIFAALHDELLILRSPRDEQDARLADRRFPPEPYWGAFRLGGDRARRSVSDAELARLLEDAWRLAQ